MVILDATIVTVAMPKIRLALDFSPTGLSWVQNAYSLVNRVPENGLDEALHPLTIEQNAITSFNSRFTLVPAFANTIGPGFFLQSDW